MSSSLRLAPFALIFVLAGCGEPLPTLPPAGSHSSAHELHGVDSEGKALSLSDYRGQVVLVDFWIDNCPPCRAQHVEDKKLMQKYQGKPFVILGVNADRDVETMRRSEQQQGMTWRSIWDGRTFENTKAYGVQPVPSLFLVDHNGRLVKTFPPGKPNETVLENDIEKLLLTAQKEQTQTVAK